MWEILWISLIFLKKEEQGGFAGYRWRLHFSHLWFLFMDFVYFHRTCFGCTDWIAIRTHQVYKHSFYPFHKMDITSKANIIVYYQNCKFPSQNFEYLNVPEAAGRGNVEVREILKRGNEQQFWYFSLPPPIFFCCASFFVKSTSKKDPQIYGPQRPEYVKCILRYREVVKSILCSVGA